MVHSQPHTIYQHWHRVSALDSTERRSLRYPSDTCSAQAAGPGPLLGRPDPRCEVQHASSILTHTFHRWLCWKPRKLWQLTSFWARKSSRTGSGWLTVGQPSFPEERQQFRQWKKVFFWINEPICG